MLSFLCNWSWRRRRVWNTKGSPLWRALLVCYRTFSEGALHRGWRELAPDAERELDAVPGLQLVVQELVPGVAPVPEQAVTPAQGEVPGPSVLPEPVVRAGPERPAGEAAHSDALAAWVADEAVRLGATAA